MSKLTLNRWLSTASIYFLALGRKRSLQPVQVHGRDLPLRPGRVVRVRPRPNEPWQRVRVRSTFESEASFRADPA